ncbi:MAG: DUF4293 family protein [Cytophagales bacterium]|nr:MAG: DUF4293 family protein [Cytophagales bacterium]TAF59868.1 MAG: DUF4293 family protein [Cytophagales bacterium]
MIQRVQTIFMLVSGLLMLALVAFPLWTKQNPNGNEQVMMGAFHLIHISKSAVVGKSGTFAIGVTAILSGLLSLATIFLYNKRKLQITLGGFNVLVICVHIALTVYYVHFVANKIFNPEQSGAFGWAFVFPILALICSQMANRFVWKDEKMVRDSERLR